MRSATTVRSALARRASSWAAELLDPIDPGWPVQVPEEREELFFGLTLLKGGIH